MKGELEDLASFGLLKETTCDSDGNIYAPSNRKYGDAINAILRIAPDAKSYKQFSIDPLPKLEDGHIIDFVLEPSGDIYRSEEHTSELQSRPHLVCRLLLEKK